MYGKILVGYDEGDRAEDALALAKALADATRAKLVVAGVFQFDPFWEGRDLGFHGASVDYVGPIERAAAAVGGTPQAVPSSSPARGLHDLAEQIEADLIVVGSAHQGRLGQTLAGSVGVALLHGSPCAVAIAPRGYRDRHDASIGAIAVGFDGSDESGLALRAGTELARETGAKLQLVAVAQPPPVGWGEGDQGWHELKESTEQELRERLREARETLPEGLDVETSLISGDPAAKLRAVGTTPGTLLLVGSRAYGPLRRVLAGSVSSTLVRSASCPLIVHPRGMHAGQGAGSATETEPVS